jgi:hypothetical protein
LVEKSPDGSRCRAQAIINLFDCNNPDMAVATWIFSTGGGHGCFRADVEIAYVNPMANSFAFYNVHV